VLTARSLALDAIDASNQDLTLMFAVPFGAEIVTNEDLDLIVSPVKPRISIKQNSTASQHQRTTAPLFVRIFNQVYATKMV
jgi:hypothetical protein